MIEGVGRGVHKSYIRTDPNYLLNRLVASSLAIIDIFTLKDKKYFETSCLSKICANRQSFIVEPMRVNFKQFSFPISIVSYLPANEHSSPYSPDPVVYIFQV